MKKIFMILLCVLMMVAVPTVAFAASETEEVPDKTITEVEMTITERVVEYVKENAEGILAVLASLGSAILVKLIGGKLSNSVSTLNNNSINIAKEASDKLETATKKLDEYEGKMADFLSKLNRSEEEKKILETTVAQVDTFLKSAKVAILDLADELAELLLLANIPIAKKEEALKIHQEALKKINEIEGVINND